MMSSTDHTDDRRANLRQRLRETCMVKMRDVDVPLCSISQKQTDAIMQLFDAELEISPAAKIAVTVARAQLERGENPTPNVTGMLLIELDRFAALKSGAAGKEAAQ